MLRSVPPDADQIDLISVRGRARVGGRAYGGTAQYSVPLSPPRPPSASAFARFGFPDLFVPSACIFRVLYSK